MLLLHGLRSGVLGGYLGGLGLLRVVARLLDPAATGAWRGERFVLHSRYDTIDDLVADLRARFEPAPVITPWNSGSGFVPSASNTSAVKTLAWVRASTDPRMATLREAVAAGDRIVAEVARRGWAEDKTRLVQMCRNEFPSSVLPWLDTAIVLGQNDKPAYARILGTGGNFGRQDLSATYLTRVRDVYDDPRSTAWLTAMLTGTEEVPYLRSPVGQFDPGRAGGVQSSSWEQADAEGFVNPWASLLTLEGTMFFAAAVARREGAGYADAAVPFQVRASAGGHTTSAAGEAALGELWVPQWSVPAGVRELDTLFGEARVSWRGAPARTGLDVVRALAGLGVDRGIDSFHRFVFANRFGQSPLAVPAGRVEVRERPGVRLLAGLDRWLGRVRDTAPPGAVAARVRALDVALFAHARGEVPMAEVFAALGRCHVAVANSGAVRQKVGPLVLAGGEALLTELLPDAGRELRIALALATARDTAPGTGMRSLLSPVRLDRHRLVWTDRPVPVSTRAGVLAALPELARHRVFATTESPGTILPAVKGVRIAFTRGLRLAPADLFPSRDEERVRDLLDGLLTVDWAGSPDRLLAGPERADPALDLLGLFASAVPLRYYLDHMPQQVLLRPAAAWPAQLQAGHVTAVLDDAARRLRISTGLRVVTPRGSPGAEILGWRLLLRPRGGLPGALRRVTDLTDPSPLTAPSPTVQEQTA